MKPKVFIGSSVEGLSVAYAIQQNLSHDAEATVWDQGVFELSKTTIESLTAVVDIVDFAIFVFSPDDLIVMRNQSSSTIRDNVIFEFGLFVGKLNRERVFFIEPTNTPFHIPTDLLGITPGKYDPDRDDKSFQAATGAACSQIRTQIKKLGSIKPLTHNDAADESDLEVKEYAWIDDFISSDYVSAKQKLENDISTKSSKNAEADKVWLAFIDVRLNTENAVSNFYKLEETYSDDPETLSLFLNLLNWDGFSEHAIQVGKRAVAKHPNFVKLALRLAESYKNNDELSAGIDTLKASSPESQPTVAIALAEIYEKDKNLTEASLVLNKAYLHNPNDEDLNYKYARILQDEKKHKEAMFLLDKLTFNNPKTVDYWGYLSNSCLALELYDKAMASVKMAERLSEGKSAWILHNIGNMLNHKDFYTEAVEWLNKGLVLDQSSLYAHDRLAKALKGKEDEQKKFETECSEGRKLIKQMNKITEVIAGS